MIVRRKAIREEPHHCAGDGKIMIRVGDGGRDDKHRGETRRRKGEVMKKILSMILAVMMEQLRNMDKMTMDAMMNTP
jgi:hypothetical protein